jgi:hypothetical protein
MLFLFVCLPREIAVVSVFWSYEEIANLAR